MENLLINFLKKKKTPLNKVKVRKKLYTKNEHHYASWKGIFKRHRIMLFTAYSYICFSVASFIISKVLFSVFEQVGGKIRKMN